MSKKTQEDFKRQCLHGILGNILPKITDLGNFTQELSPQSDFTNILVDK